MDGFKTSLLMGWGTKIVKLYFFIGSFAVSLTAYF